LNFVNYFYIFLIKLKEYSYICIGNLKNEQKKIHIIIVSDFKVYRKIVRMVYGIGLGIDRSLAKQGTVFYILYHKGEENEN
jgi:hypothetical protein